MNNQIASKERKLAVFYIVVGFLVLVGMIVVTTPFAA